MRLFLYTLGKRFQQPRLTHPGLAHQEHNMPVTQRRALPRIIQNCQLTLASDDRTGGRGMSGCEPAFGCTLTKRFPDGNRLAEALDCVLAEERKLKKIPGELVRRRAHKNAVGICGRLKSSR